MKGIKNTSEEFKNSNLTFHTNTAGDIYKIESDILDYEVMMDWESNIMDEHSKIVAHNNGDILEIGFGLGISADYIQAHGITSHTIVEIHPDILIKAQTWASDKPNVTIVSGDWYDIKDTLGQYDGIFYDGCYDTNVTEFMSVFVNEHIKEGGKFTYYNPSGENDVYQLSPTFNMFSVTPEPNGYYNESTYYVPTVQY